MIYAVYLVISPFITAILSSAIIAYIFYPMYQKFNKLLKREHLASFLVALIIVLLVTVPSIFLLRSVSKEAYIIYSIGSQKITGGTLFECQDPGLICNTFNSFSDLRTRYYLKQALENVTTFILDSISNFALSIPAIILNLFIILFITFYLFIAAHRFKKKMFSVIPYQKKHLQLILHNLNDVTHAIVYGVFVIAIIEALLGILGFTLVGASSPVLWGLFIGFLALLPFIGAAIVWIPAFLFYLATNMYWQAGIILIFGVIISMIDTFIKPVVMSNKADLNPALMLIGILGGLNLFGFVGIVLGPLILSFFIVLFKIYMKEKITL